MTFPRFLSQIPARHLNEARKPLLFAHHFFSWSFSSRILFSYLHNTTAHVLKVCGSPGMWQRESFLEFAWLILRAKNKKAKWHGKSRVQSQGVFQSPFECSIWGWFLTEGNIFMASDGFQNKHKYFQFVFFYRVRTRCLFEGWLQLNICFQNPGDFPVWLQMLCYLWQ